MKIKLTINENNAQAMKALAALMLAIGNINTVGDLIKTTEEQKPEAIVKPIKTVKDTPKTFPTTPPAAEQEPTIAQANEGESETGQTKPVTSLQDVRDALSKKVNDHRDKIKDKLTALNAKSVTLLEAKHYTEMFEFLNSL